ncbi:NUDIX domain-containing protein [Micromonospora sp. NPDC049301]|uniref:NUDIX domain-containing protein n=1 Tax=Micromonospora sp. NPDC049301 TaxID=3155723 RepID=UPI0034258AE4
MELRRGVGVYGVLRESGRVLLVRDGTDGEVPGVWRLPGGAVAHAEHPEHAVVREVARQTGLTVTVDRLLAAVADVTTYPEDDVALHTDRLAFELSVLGGTLRDAADGPTDQARWVTTAEAARLPLAPFSAELLGLPVTPLPTGTRRPREPFPPAHPDRRLRFGAYGLVTDPAGRILLTQIADGYPGAGQWHLPGGGTDHGEQPTTGLLRELVEEGGQLGRVVELLGVDNLHNPAALGPEGRPLDWHGVRVIYRVLVDVPTDAVVTESAGGSTARAGWFTPAQAADLPLTGIAASAIGRRGR